MKHLLAAATILLAAPASANEPLLNETVGFTGQIFHLETSVPGVVIAAVRNDESAIASFGEIVVGSGRQPDGNTHIGVGSIMKSFTGLALAHAVADGTVALTDPAAPHINLVDTLPERGGRHICLVDLATHSSGLARELVPVEGVERYSKPSFAANVADDPLLFAPGEGMLYSNIGLTCLLWRSRSTLGCHMANCCRRQCLTRLS